MLKSIALQAGLITGHIYNDEGEPLPFASIYIMGTTIGTASNPEGYFELPIANGTYELVFQYIGYQQKHITVAVDEERLSLE